MNQPVKIFLRLFVKPFYRENAAVFLFSFIMLFYIVGQVDGAGLLQYHYMLVMAMLTSKVVFILVFFLWFLYTRKYTAFVAKVLTNPQCSFLYIYNCLDRKQQFWLFFKIEVLLFMPVLLYSMFIIAVGVYHHLYLTALLILLYLLLLCIFPALWHVHCLSNPGKRITLPWQGLRKWPKLPSYYPVFILRYVVRKQKMIWLGIKVFTCGILYLIATNNKITPSDIGTVYLFFNFGIIGNGIILHGIREFEETQLKFYRGAPVSLTNRFLQYSFLYLILLLPEFVITGMLAPGYLSYNDAINFALCGYSFLLLINTITFLQDFSMRDFLKVILLVFSVQYVFILSGHLNFLYPFFFILSIAIFLLSYYKFERNI